jgi:hypothetical protein
MPVERGIAHKLHCGCLRYDDRQYNTTEHIDVDYNGYITLRFDGPS